MVVTPPFINHFLYYIFLKLSLMRLLHDDFLFVNKQSITIKSRTYFPILIRFKNVKIYSNFDKSGQGRLHLSRNQDHRILTKDRRY